MSIIRVMRLQTGFTQSEFANMFEIPLTTLEDWEQGRCTPPAYVENMIRTILEFRGMPVDMDYISACEERRKSVERAMAILLTATEGPDEEFMKVLNSYILGQISLEEMERRVDNLEYLDL